MCLQQRDALPRHTCRPDQGGSLLLAGAAGLGVVLPDVAMGAIENNISHEIIIQPTHVQKELLTTPTKKTKAEEFFFIGKIRMPIPLLDHKPKDIKPTFITPPRYVA